MAESPPVFLYPFKGRWCFLSPQPTLMWEFSSSPARDGWWLVAVLVEQQRTTTSLPPPPASSRDHLPVSALILIEQLRVSPSLHIIARADNMPGICSDLAGRKAKVFSWPGLTDWLTGLVRSGSLGCPPLISTTSNINDSGSLLWRSWPAS